MPAPHYDEQRYISEDEIGQRSRGSRQYPVAYARYERYEIDPPSLKARQDDMKGKKVTFFMSGDRDCKGVDLCINNKIRTFGSLLAELDKHPKIKPRGGVRFIFRKDENRYRKMEDLSEIQSGDMLIVSDRPSIDKTLNYGFPAGPSPTKGLQRSPLPRRSQKGQAPLRRSLSRKSDTICVMNKERMTTYKLNPNTTQLFEQVLDDIGEMLKLSAYKPLSMHSATPSSYTKVDSFTKLNSQLHANEIRSSGRDTPKFLICKNGEHPENALSEKMRKTYEKKGLIKPSNDGRSGNHGNDRYADEGDDPTDDQVEDGMPEPEHHDRRRQRKEMEREPSPPKQSGEPPVTSRRTQKHNGIPKSQSRESVASKDSTSRIPKHHNKTDSNRSQERKLPPQRRQLEDESQQNQDASDSDSDYPEPRVVEPKTPKERAETPEY